MQMYDVNSGKSYPASYVSLSGQDTFTVSFHVFDLLRPAATSRCDLSVFFYYQKLKVCV